MDVVGRFRDTLLILAVAAGLAASDAVTVSPAWMRVALAPGATAERAVAVQAPPGAQVLAVTTACPCIAVATPLPAPVGQIVLRISSALTGVKEVAIVTSQGEARLHIQVVVDGQGEGLAVLRQATAAAAAEPGGELLLICHDLRGEIRNCGCSQGSLGGLDHLAALPGLVAAERPGLRVRCVLSGDVDGMRSGVAAALIARGWERADARFRVTAEVAAAIADPAVRVVIPTTATAIQHRRLLRPVLDRGMTVEAVRFDARGEVAAVHTIPIDASLPAERAILTGFAEPAVAVDAVANPSAACLSCHAGAHATWAASRHTRALESLRAEDRTDGCIRCHVTPQAVGPPGGGVHCQACHRGAEAHAARPQVKTGGAVDCRSCHDAKHDPGFDRLRDWLLIEHGR